MVAHSIRWAWVLGSIWITLAGGAAPLWAQDQEADDSLALGVWSLGLTGKLSASQAAYNNWQEGGLNTLAFTTGLSGQARRITQNWEQTHELRLAYGLVKQDTLDARKADDVIRLNSALQYRGRGFFRTFNPTLSATGRTQFAPGYNYDKNPFGDGRQTPVKVSDFLAPATFTQSVGLTYDPRPWFRQRLGVAAKETVVLIERLQPLYNPEGEQVRLEIGMESRTQFDREVFENVRVQSSLALFAAFNNPEVPDALWENVVTMKVNNWLNTGFEFVTLYDRDVSDRPQLKEVLSLGVSLIFL